MSGSEIPLPPPPPPPSSNFALLQILSKDKLTGTNYLDWNRALRITLRYEKKEYVLDEPVPEVPDDDATDEEKRDYEKRHFHSIEVACLMLATMTPELQKNYENLEAFEMNAQLKEMFQDQAKQERFDVTKSLLSCKLQEGASVCAHVRKMKAYIDRLELLGVSIARELAIDIVLNSLTSAYEQFVMNYNMHNLEKTLMELHGMLKTAEAGMAKSRPISSTTPVLAIREGNVKKKKANHPKGKGKGKVGKTNQGYKERHDSDIVPNGDPKKATCFYYQDKGHWKRSYPKYLEDLKNNKVKGAGPSGMFLFPQYFTTSYS